MDGESRLELKEEELKLVRNYYENKIEMLNRVAHHKDEEIAKLESILKQNCEHDYKEINTGIKFLKCTKCGNELL